MTHEGTNAIKVSELLILTSRFEIIKMEDHENFREFDAKLMDIANSSFNLGETILNSKVVRKIFRSLHKILRAKATAIEESKDVDSLKINELVGSLQTFEMTLGSPKKAREVALNVIKEESLSFESEDDEKILEGDFTNFAKKFRSTWNLENPRRNQKMIKIGRTQLEKRKKEEGEMCEKEVENWMF